MDVAGGIHNRIWCSCLEDMGVHCKEGSYGEYWPAQENIEPNDLFIPNIFDIPKLYGCNLCMTEFVEEVVLVDENDNEIGRVPKAEVHGIKTPLHRAFSSFIFNSNGQILLQQRSHKKKTWPLVWSNSCCGHPLPEETREHAVVRRIKDELGMDVSELNVKFMSPYRYCFSRFGVMENEICPIYVVHSDAEPHLNDDEVEQVKWMPWEEYVADTQNNPGEWSEWCVEEVAILDSSNMFGSWLESISR